MEIEFLLASFIASILSTSVLSNDVCALDEVPYGVGSWLSEQLGNHRALIQVAEKADAVKGSITTNHRITGWLSSLEFRMGCSVRCWARGTRGGGWCTG